LTQHNGTTLTEYLIDQQPSLAVILREKIGLQNTHYVHGLRGIQSQVANAAWTEAMSDGLGSVRGWIDGSQNFVSDVDYNPYGVPDNAVNGYGFTGEMTDDNGLVYLRARYYDPNAGVFASLDPFEGVHGRPMSMNGYSWVEGNVANKIDPTGRDCESWHELMYGTTGGCLPKNANCSPDVIRKRNCLALMNEINSGNIPSYEHAIGCYTCDLNITLLDVNRVEDYRKALQNLVNDGQISQDDMNRYVQLFSTLNPIIIPADIAWGDDGYIEGAGGSADLLVGLIRGQEIVYNFSTFQRSRFEYGGGGISIPSIAGNIYYGIVEGFVEDYSNRFEGGAFLGQYNGFSSSRSTGVGYGFPGIGGTYFHGWSGEYPAIQGNTFYIGASLSPTILLGVSIDLGQWVLHYWDTGYRKSYANNCKVNIAELRNDILSGNDSPVSRYLAEGLNVNVGRNIALAFAEPKIVDFENNCRQKKTQC